MTKIEILEKLINESKNISFENKNDFDFLLKRIKMYLRVFFKKDTLPMPYSIIDKITFTPIIFVQDKEQQYEKFFNNAKKEVIDLLMVAKEEIQMFEN